MFIMIYLYIVLSILVGFGLGVCTMIVVGKSTDYKNSDKNL